MIQVYISMDQDSQMDIQDKRGQGNKITMVPGNRAEEVHDLVVSISQTPMVWNSSMEPKMAMLTEKWKYLHFLLIELMFTPLLDRLIVIVRWQGMIAKLVGALIKWRLENNKLG